MSDCVVIFTKMLYYMYARWSYCTWLLRSIIYKEIVRMLVFEKKDAPQEPEYENEILDNSRVLFATCGWQFANFVGDSPMFYDIPNVLDTVGKKKCDTDCSAIWSTDGGSFASNPRIYFIKDYLASDRVLVVAKLSNLLDDILFYDMEVEYDFSLRLGKDCYNSTKYTLSKTKEDGVYLLTYFFAGSPDSDMDVIRKVEYVVDRCGLKDIRLVGFNNPEEVLTMDMKEEIIRHRGGDILSLVCHILFVWAEVAKSLGVEPAYLEVVKGSTEIVCDGHEVVLGDLSFETSVTDPFKAYVATSPICAETGFCLDEDLKDLGDGKVAICMAY